MTRKQKKFLATMTTAQAVALMAKFGNNPYTAYSKSSDTYSAFAIAFEMVNPDAYIQMANLASGVSFTVQY